MAVAKRIVRHEERRWTLPRANVEGRRRRVHVIEERVDALKALSREKLFGIEAAVGAAELNVAFMRNGALPNVRGHYAGSLAVTIARSVAAKPFVLCDPSQKGLVWEPPHRQSATLGLSMVEG